MPSRGRLCVSHVSRVRSALIRESKATLGTRVAPRRMVGKLHGVKVAQFANGLASDCLIVFGRRTKRERSVRDHAHESLNLIPPSSLNLIWLVDVARRDITSVSHLFCCWKTPHISLRWKTPHISHFAFSSVRNKEVQWLGFSSPYAVVSVRLTIMSAVLRNSCCTRPYLRANFSRASVCFFELRCWSIRRGSNELHRTPDLHSVAFLSPSTDALLREHLCLCLSSRHDRGCYIAYTISDNPHSDKQSFRTAFTSRRYPHRRNSSGESHLYP